HSRFLLFFCPSSLPPPDLHSFPTRRSSDLVVSHTFHPRFEQLELLRITQSQLIQPLGFSLADVAGRGLRVGVGVFVVPAQGVPMLIAGALHRLADVVSGERHEEKVPRRKRPVRGLCTTGRSVV